MDSETILIGHALDNDLKTLRIIHHRCVDTVVLYPHSLGAPYRRALRDLYVASTVSKGFATYPHPDPDNIWVHVSRVAADP